MRWQRWIYTGLVVMALAQQGTLWHMTVVNRLLEQRINLLSQRMDLLSQLMDTLIQQRGASAVEPERQGRTRAAPIPTGVLAGDSHDGYAHALQPSD